jgi:ATP-dependent helicase/nuclease subunit A
MSTWLSANAGSGKTRVLTDRVARLLLDEVPPERILCLTYTKAAAMEMQNRLFSRLGDWAMTPEDDLARALAKVGVPAARLTPDLLSRARTLFARAIETPGGLKIQTIHSFCASVLRRFPLEAGVSPGFTEIDERVQARLIADLLDEIAEDPRGDMPSTPWCPISATRTASRSLAAPSPGGRTRSIRRSWDAVAQAMGIDPGLDEAGVLATALIGDEATVCDAIWPVRSRKAQRGTDSQHPSHHAMGGDDARRARRSGSGLPLRAKKQKPLLRQGDQQSETRRSATRSVRR